MLVKRPFGARINRSDPLGAAIVGCWRFAEGGGRKVFDSTGRNHGSLVNGPTWGIGDRGAAVTLDGVNDRITLSSTGGLIYSPTKPYSIAIRFKSSVTATGCVYAEGNDPNVYYFVIEITYPGLPGFGSANVKIRDDTGAIILNASSTINTLYDGKWHTLIWTDNAGVAVLYVDGKKDATNFNYTPGSGVSATATDLGVFNVVGGFDFFSGTFGGTTLFNRVLLPQEALRLFIDPDCYLVGAAPDEGFVASSGALVGTAAITFNATGNISGSGALVATSAITFAATGAISGKGALTSASSVIFAASGGINATGALIASSAITFDGIGSLNGGAGQLVGTSVIAFSTSGTLSGKGALVATSAVTFTATATVAGKGALNGSSSILFNANAVTTPGAMFGRCNIYFDAYGEMHGCYRYQGCVTSDFNYTPDGTAACGSPYSGCNVNDFGYQL